MGIRRVSIPLCAVFALAFLPACQFVVGQLGQSGEQSDGNPPKTSKQCLVRGALRAASWTPDRCHDLASYVCNAHQYSPQAREPQSDEQLCLNEAGFSGCLRYVLSHADTSHLVETAPAQDFAPGGQYNSVHYECAPKAGNSVPFSASSRSVKDALLGAQAACLSAFPADEGEEP